MPGTALVPISAVLRDRVRKELTKGADLESVLGELVRPEAAALPERAVPAPMVLTGAQVSALSALPDLYSKICPTSARPLSADERVKILTERETIEALLALKDRKEAIREILATDLDREAERLGLVTPEEIEVDGKTIPATPRDAKGHYLLKHDIPVPELGKKIDRSLSPATWKTKIDPGRLLEAYETGKITRAQYFAVTAEARSFSSEKAAKAVAKDPELAFLLAKHATVTVAPVATVQPR
jgi:hypothetical protein